jgi:diguanylate cyclase (GGDEF)-like protein
MNTSTLQALLALSLIFGAVMLYLFLRSQRGGSAVALLRNERRLAEITAEISQTLVSSMNSREVLYLIVTRISEVFDGSECSIVQLGEGGQLGKILVKAANPNLRDSPLDLQAYPEIRQASESHELLFLPNAERGGTPCSVVSIPMSVHGVTLGVVHVQFSRVSSLLSESHRRFLRTMTAAGGNAVRNAQLFEEVEHKSRTDYLTGLVNHRSFQATLSTELTRARRHGHQLSVMIADIDHLKAINEKLGHVIGDSVIREVAETLRMSCRNADMAARYGGEEYGVILPETPLIEALQVAERIRERINESIYTGVGHVTVSIGVASYPTDALGKDELVRAAERAVLISKNGGRNRVSYFDAGLGADRHPV